MGSNSPITDGWDSPVMAERDRNEDTGQFADEFEDLDFIEAIEEQGGSASTTEIAEIVGCDRRTAYLRLNELEEAGDVSSRKVGNALLWQK